MQPESIVTLTQQAKFREIGDDGVILMIDTGQLYSTNSSGTAFIRRLAAEKTVGVILDEMSEEFDVGRDILAHDIAELVTYLEIEGVVRVEIGA